MTNYEHFIRIVEKYQDELRTNPQADTSRLAVKIEIAKMAIQKMPVLVAQMEFLSVRPAANGKSL